MTLNLSFGPYVHYIPAGYQLETEQAQEPMWAGGVAGGQDSIFKPTHSLKSLGTKTRYVQGIHETRQNKQQKRNKHFDLWYTHIKEEEN